MMKRKVVLLATVALFALGMTSCNKEDNTNRKASFTATVEGTDAKMTVNTASGAQDWQINDKLYISTGSQDALYKVTGINAGVAELTYAGTGEEPILTGTDYTAIYPDTLFVQRNRVKLPLTQSYRASNPLRNAPMFATSNTRNLAFKNLCGVIGINVIKSGASVKAIEISNTEKRISGNFDVAWNNGNPTLTYVNGGNRYIGMTPATPVNVNNGAKFYFYIPAATYTNLKIKVTFSDGSTVERVKESATEILRSSIRTFKIEVVTGEIVDPLLDGEFTVNATTGEKVNFTKGNLQYRISTGVYTLPEHQYDFISGNDNLNVTNDTYEGTIDLFGWGTANNPRTWQANNSLYPSNNAKFANGDWARIFGTAAEGWKTLSLAEWQCVLYGRPDAVMSTIGGKKAHFAMVRVNGVLGMLLFPDNCVWPSSVTVPANINLPTGRSSSYPMTEYTASQWSTIERVAKCAFLPCAGYRDPTTNTITTNSGSYGYYWTSSSYSTNAANYVYFKTASNATSTLTPNGYKYYGRSVRVARTVR